MPAPNRGITQLLGTTTFRLAAGLVALFVVAAAVVVWLLHARTNAILTEQVLAGLRTEAEALAVIVREGGPKALDAAVGERSRPGGVALYHLANDTGERIAGNLPVIPPALAAQPQGGVFRYQTDAGGAAASRLAVAIHADAGPRRRLIVGRDVEDQRDFAEEVGRTFLYGFGGLALAGLLGGLLMSRALVQRIDAINAAAHSIMSGDLSRRIADRGSGDEIDGLAANLNAMLDRIEQLMGGLREVSDNIAHDLKTPLTRLRSRAEAALRGNGGQDGYREGLERVLEESDGLIKTFNALLLIARLEAGAVEENMEVFDASALVRDVAELYEPVAEEAGLALVVDADVVAMMRANKQLVGQAVANLVDNAIKYGRRGERGGEPISVSVEAMPDGLEICVADRGPGIPPEDRERALRRFVRLEQSRTRPGTGLGLSLVAAVARLHGGEVRLADSAPGRPSPGLKVVVRLPARLYSEGTVPAG